MGFNSGFKGLSRKAQDDIRLTKFYSVYLYVKIIFVSLHKARCIDVYIVYGRRGLCDFRLLFLWKQSLCSAGDIRQRRSVDSYRQFGALLPFKMGPICCTKTSVNNYQSTLCNIPEERRSYTCVFNPFQPYQNRNLVIHFDIIECKLLKLISEFKIYK